MILLLEGVGRTGKSTVAERLCADLPGYQSVHFSVPDCPDAFEYFWGKLPGKSVENLIIDRFHWSNHAYGATFGGSVLTDLDWWRLDQWLAERATAAILLVDDPRGIYRRMMDTAAQDPSKRVLDSVQQIGEIQNGFNRCFDRSSISPRWSVGLDQLFDASGEALEPYLNLLAYVSRGGREISG